MKRWLKLEKKPVERIHDLTLVLADQSVKAIAQVTALAQELLSGKLPPERVKKWRIVLRAAPGLMTFRSARKWRRSDRSPDQYSGA